MSPKDQEMFLRLYKSLKKMLTYMETKNVRLEDPVSNKGSKRTKIESPKGKLKLQEGTDDVNMSADADNLTDMLDLPHVDQVIKTLEQKVASSATMGKMPALLPELGHGRTATNSFMQMEDATSHLSP